MSKLEGFVACAQNLRESGMFWPDITNLAVARLDTMDERDETLGL